MTRRTKALGFMTNEIVALRTVDWWRTARTSYARDKKGADVAKRAP
jgi:hypothetical protein